MNRTRTDQIPITKAPKVMPNGSLMIKARLARIGAYTYGDKRELKHPDDLFHVDSLATIPAAPLTVMHPPGGVTPDSWRNVAIGSVSAPRREGKYLVADVVVHDPDAINAVKDGRLSELSMGFDATVIDGAGEYEGERYDARQTNIRYNHTAIGPAGMARGGRDVCLVFDAADETEDEGLPGVIDRFDARAAGAATEPVSLTRARYAEMKKIEKRR